MRNTLKLLLLILLVSGCATSSLTHNKNLVIFETGVADGEVLVLPSGDGNFYIPNSQTIFLDKEGMERDDIQIHEYLHWAFDNLTYIQQTELFAKWGTFYILNKRRNNGKGTAINTPNVIQIPF